jgi:hypothetical protein
MNNTILYSSSLEDKKKQIRENLLNLEKLGMVSSADDYQALISAIASVSNLGYTLM